jgi:threonine dehydratase
MVTRRDVEKAHAAISRDILRTPLIHSRRLSDRTGVQTLLKLETMQITGAFKERGALNRLLSLSAGERRRGVIAASAGNHAQGVAYHSRRLKVAATIVMPRATPLVKVDATRRFGARIVLHGDTYDDACDHALQLAREHGYVFVHPFDDPIVIAGQGTIAVEALEDDLCRDLDAILCPVGGGGLISGVAAYVKAVRPHVRVIGVEAASCPCARKALDAGRRVRLDSASSLADGIAVKKVGRLTLPIIRRLVDDVVTVEEDEIAAAVLMFLEVEKIVVEGAGATPLAALMGCKLPPRLRRALCIVSGGNIDVNVLNRIITRGLSATHRTVQLKIRLRDVPGSLKRALGILERHNTNILEIIHHRFESSPTFGSVDVSISLETRSLDHVRQVEDDLRRQGYLLG